MRHRTRSFAVIVAGLLLTTCVTAFAAAGPSAADAAAIRNFKLTTDFMHKWEAYEAMAAKHPCELSPFIIMSQKGRNGPQSLDEAAADFDAHPGVHAALTKVGLTAREALIGMSALMGAAMQSMAEQYQAMMKSHNMHMNKQHLSYVSDANMAFFRKHKDEYLSYQRKIGREEYTSDHGKMPECMKSMMK